MPHTRLKYPGRCLACGQQVPAGATAWWEPAERTVTCSVCAPPAHTGNSVRQLVEQNQTRHEQRVRQTWGPLAGLALAVKPTDRASDLARKGAAAEEQLTAVLDRHVDAAGGTLAVLHDRGIPGRRENIDHIVITPAGVWAVDAKAYSGTIRIPWLRRDRLIIGGRDQARLVEQSNRQQRLIGDALARLDLAQVPVHGALCFLDASFAFGVNGSSVGEVTICSPRRLKHSLPTVGPMTGEQVAWVAHRLGSWFHPAG